MNAGHGRSCRRQLFGCLSLVVVLLLASSQVASAVTIFTALLTGEQVNPPTGSTRLVSALVVLNDEQNRLQIELGQVSCPPPCLGSPFLENPLDIDGTLTPDPDDDVTGIHIHRGAPGMNGPEVFGFINPNSDLNGDLVIGPGAQLTSAWDSNEGIGTTLGVELTHLFAGNLYIDIHTNAFGGGELRGQIVPEPDTALLVGIGFMVLAARARAISNQP